MADSLTSNERLFQEAFGLLRRAQYLLTEACTKHEQAMQQDETAEPRKHEQAMRLLRKYLDRECNPFEPNNQSETYKELAAFLYPTSLEEPRETSARDILQRLVDTCELATGAPWPALDEARAFLSGSPEEPTHELSPSESASFDKTLARSPRRVPLRDSDAAFNLGVLPTEQPENGDGKQNG